MNKRNNKQTGNDESGAWKRIQEQFDSEQDSGSEQLQSMLKNFANDFESHPYVQKQAAKQSGSAGGWVMALRRFAVTAGVGIAMALIAMVVFFGSPTPSWAQISEQFARSEFLSASLFFKEDGLSDPQHIELWMGRGGKVRIRIGEQLIFGEKGEVVASFNLKTRKQAKADEMGAGILKMLGADETFSMETIMKGIAGGKLVDKTPILNPNAMISEDLVVYDMDSGDESNPQWFRIWALKKSKLPIRIRMWDPRDAQMVEMVIDYSKPQPDMFFDAKAFASTLSTVRTDQLNLAYLHLKDAGGKIYVPGIKDENAMMSIVTKTIDGEPFSLSHYADKNVLIRFWNKERPSLNLDRLVKINEKYKDCENLEIVTVALHKNAETVRREIATRNLNFTVLHEPGKGFNNSLARALGVKRGDEYWLITGGKAIKVQPPIKELDILCNGLNAFNHMRLTRFAKFGETTKERILELCGKPHDKLTQGDTELWSYKFISNDKLSRCSVSIRFDKEGKYSGYASSGSLINPSNVVFEITKDFWDAKVVPQIDKEDLPENNSDHHFEIWLKSDQGGSSVIGGGHPRTEVVPDRKYNVQVEPATYSPVVMLIGESYKRIKEVKLHEGIAVGDNENVSIRFGEGDQPQIERSDYKPKPKDTTKHANDLLLKKPDHKKRLGSKIDHNDPKFLPWQLHLKEIAKRYERRPLPKEMEMFEKGTDEEYKFIMSPQNLPGYEGYSVRAFEGDLKEMFRYNPLTPGLARWPDDVVTVKVNHDIVYRDDVDHKQRYLFMLDQMGYTLDKITEDRKVFVAKYDGRELPDPEMVTAPKVCGWGYFSANLLINMMTRSLSKDLTATGPVFIDETNLPSEATTIDEHKKIAITLEMPSVESMDDFENLRPWYEENFGITFVEETRAVEIFVVGRR